MKPTTFDFRRYPKEDVSVYYSIFVSKPFNFGFYRGVHLSIVFDRDVEENVFNVCFYYSTDDVPRLEGFFQYRPTDVFLPHLLSNAVSFFDRIGLHCQELTDLKDKYFDMFFSPDRLSYRDQIPQNLSDNCIRKLIKKYTRLATKESTTDELPF